ncbi:hypothetical protein ACN9MZ_26105 [Pseudoduganella sp. S-14]|uniref:hypothetical protein n=1 Tax=Pseudoduganella sp. S-14 TaxID=3404065 RepID=UPI003CEA64C4
MNGILNTSWFHGTQHHIDIEAWAFPPGTHHKPELVAHSAVFLTTDRILAMGAGGKLYTANINPSAKVLDLRIPGKESEEFRRVAILGKLGKDHSFAKADYWSAAWRQGKMMRFASSKPHHIKDQERIMQAKGKYDAGDRSEETIRLMIKGQNLTRAWIEEIVNAGRKLGYDALIGTEPDTYRPGGAVICEVLFALNANALTAPVHVL